MYSSAGDGAGASSIGVRKDALRSRQRATVR